MSEKALTLEVGESWLLEFDFARTLADSWRPGKAYTTNDVIRPRAFNGFNYIATSGGQSEQAEPDWPLVISDTVEDGTVLWTAQDFDDTGSDTLATGPVTTDGSGTLDTPVVTSTKVTAQFTALDKGLEVVTCKATTVLGETIHGSFRITIK